MPTYERLDYGSPDGSHWGGASTDALGMYGVTPVTQYTAVGAASTYLATVSTSSSVILQISTMTTAGRLLGLWV